ncbi:MAG: M48 family metalloprotease [Burkholderiaceae bacterium]|nr:M48 family metalloprotease [Burkholderiaceae bacterium]
MATHFEHQDDARRQSRRLVLLFSLAVIVTGLCIQGVFTALWMWVSVDGSTPPLEVHAAIAFVTLLLVLGGWWIETTNMQMPGAAERMAKRMGARDVRPETSHAEKRLSNVLDEICIAAHMPRPRLMVVPRIESINAFALGWSDDDATVVVTGGVLDYLTREEMQGLIAHECSHLHEGDTHLHMQLAGMVLGLELVYTFGDDMLALDGRMLIGKIVSVIYMLVGWFGWIAGQLLQASVARQREFLADARAVQWTRSRDGLGGVLRKAWGQYEQEGTYQYRREEKWNPAFRHLLLIDGFRKTSRWFDSHPPLTERLRRLYGRNVQPIVPQRQPDTPEA